MDDGAHDAAQSIEMLKLEWAQGVRTVVLTPHLYPEQERPETFFARRQKAYEELRSAIASLPQEKQGQIPGLVLGAEVAWIPGLADLQSLEKLCYEDSKYLLIELPFLPWGERLVLSLNDLMNRTGLTPVIAHVDRYFTMQSKKQIAQLCELGLPMQLSAAAMGSILMRRRAFRMMRTGTAQLLISDCHNTTSRQPNLDGAYSKVYQKLGASMAAELEACSDTLLKKHRENNIDRT